MAKVQPENSRVAIFVLLVYRQKYSNMIAADGGEKKLPTTFPEKRKGEKSSSAPFNFPFLIGKVDVNNLHRI